MRVKSISDLLKQTWKEFSEDNAIRLAAALACYTILSLAPLVVITLKVASWTLRDEAASGQVQRQMQQLVGHAGAAAITDMVKSSNSKGSGVLASIVSLAILLFSASGVFVELQDSMNTIWEVKPRPNLSWWDMVKKRFTSMGMVFGIIFLLLVSMFITSTLGGVLGAVFGGNTDQGTVAKIVGYISDFVVTVVVVWALFMLIFKYLPDAKIQWNHVWLGALVTAVLFKLGQYALAAYFYMGSTTSAYGAAGSLVAVLLWAYYSSCILFFGAEFTQVYTKRLGHPIHPDKDSVVVTDEERAQQGIPRRDDLQEAAEADAPGKAVGAAYARRRAVPDRRIVTITRPTVDSTRATALAGAGLAGGLVVGALGLLAGRKYTGMGLKEIHLQQRLDRLESVLGRGRQMQRRAMEINIKQRLDSIESRAHAARHAIRRHQDHRPEWAKRLAEMVRGNDE